MKGREAVARGDSGSGSKKSQYKQSMEQYFVAGLEYLTRGVQLLHTLREKLGSGNSTAKNIVSAALEALRLSIGEFNHYLESQPQTSSSASVLELEEANKLLQEYRSELDNMRKNNRELRNIVAAKRESRDREEEEYDRELNRSRPDPVSFSRQGKHSPNAFEAIPETMFRSQHSHARVPEESYQERHNRSYLSINLDRSPDVSHGKSGMPRPSPPVTSLAPPSQLKTSLILQGPLDGSQGLNRAQIRVLEEEISTLDATILSQVAALYDKFNTSPDSRGN
jgi:DNA-binding transcriptional MerR regulator